MKNLKTIYFDLLTGKFSEDPSELPKKAIIHTRVYIKIKSMWFRLGGKVSDHELLECLGDD